MERTRTIQEHPKVKTDFDALPDELKAAYLQDRQAIEAGEHAYFVTYEGDDFITILGETFIFDCHDNEARIAILKFVLVDNLPTGPGGGVAAREHAQLPPVFVDAISKLFMPLADECELLDGYLDVSASFINLGQIGTKISGHMETILNEPLREYSEIRNRKFLEFEDNYQQIEFGFGFDLEIELGCFGGLLLILTKHAAYAATESEPRGNLLTILATLEPEEGVRFGKARSTLASFVYSGTCDDCIADSAPALGFADVGWSYSLVRCNTITGVMASTRLSAHAGVAGDDAIHGRAPSWTARTGGLQHRSAEPIHAAGLPAMQCDDDQLSTSSALGCREGGVRNPAAQPNARPITLTAREHANSVSAVKRKLGSVEQATLSSSGWITKCPSIMTSGTVDKQLLSECSVYAKGHPNPESAIYH